MTSEIFLELLEREAAPVEFEGPILEARAAGASAATLADLERAKLSALRVRALLERRSRREAELAALVDTASDLAGLRDVDAVLRAIVHRARRLLHSDTAYITLPDPEHGDTYMRVTDGCGSQAFRECRLSMGDGLGGLVAQTGMPYATRDYFADSRFHHTSGIDHAVREEGIVAICGVPLKLGGRVIGVLFASHRSARPYAPEEIALLVSLAAHATVALDSARLLSETRTALAELSAANEAMHAHYTTVERAAQAHDRMTDLVVRGGGVEDVAAVAADILGGALLVLDADGRRIARVDSPGTTGRDKPGTTTGNGQFGSDVGELLDDERIVGEIAVAAAQLGRTAHLKSLWAARGGAGSEPLCTLVLHHPEELSDSDQRILERAALVTALLLLFRRSIAEAEGRVRGELLDDLLNGRVPDREALLGRTELLGVDLANPHVLVVVDHGKHPRAAAWATSYALARHGLAANRGDHAVLLLPGTDPAAAARHAWREIGVALSISATVAGSGPADLPARAASAHSQATRCVQALHALGKSGTAAGADTLGFAGLLLDRHADVLAFLRTTLGPVIDYDERRGTPLLHTLHTYFDTGCSLSNSAKRLHIHVNTVTQRLERVTGLLGEGWQSPDRALEIQLALRVHRLREADVFTA
ncbi:helix-turn-helix domain-containing protein [Nocardia huaxiensis]|uniref:Helix-turn-helix domain-containing protein n=1 Tax=Nocardia huaxiensis TaxID=2755382 RepID=A0A7D6VAH6_9NOCA|nr:GAF domain-containing protein [Nocardia huaxiensis]QLY30431.1 helix-turn-helix domain-containing protein [Nocardia huaxiensis]UFS95972.1 helix-turn-helix domain-containing protein [Nocardia huaxiensis]